MPSIPGAPLLLNTLLYAFQRLSSEMTCSIKLIPSCFFISMRHPYTLLCTLSFPTYLSIGSRLFGLNHDCFLCLGGDVCTSSFSKIYVYSALHFRRNLLWYLLTS